MTKIMTRFDKKQALIDAVREQYSQGMITHLEYLNGAVQQVHNYNEAHVADRQKGFIGENLTGLMLAVAMASLHNRIWAEDTQLNFYL